MNLLESESTKPKSYNQKLIRLKNIAVPPVFYLGDLSKKA